MSAELFADQIGLVPALDVASTEDMVRVVEKTCEVSGVVGYKLGLTGSLRLGLAGAVQAIRRLTDLPIVYDHQKAGADMLDMAGHYASVCREAGVDALVLFPVAGPRTVREFVKHTIRCGMVPVVGGHIPEPDYCIGGGGFIIDDVLHRVIRIATDEGARHVIIPAKEVDLIRQNVSWIQQNVTDACVFLTGFGPMGGKIEQAFTAAAGCRSRFAIVGRDVTQAKDPAAAARQLIDAMRSSSLVHESSTN